MPRQKQHWTKLSETMELNWNSYTIDIEYQEVVRYDQGRFSLRFPMVVGPRYIPGPAEGIQKLSSSPSGLGWAPNTDHVPDASRITPPVQHPLDKVINPIVLQIDLAAGIPLQKIESPTHPIITNRQDNNSYHISLQHGATYADRDFELIWTPCSSEIPQASLFTEYHDDETFLLMQLMPPTTPSSDLPRIPREVVFVIDTSGSMAGTSLKEAKAALILALSRLSIRDSFNIIQFNSVTRQLYSTARQVSETRLPVGPPKTSLSASVKSSSSLTAWLGMKTRCFLYCNAIYERLVSLQLGSALPPIATS